MLIGVSIAIILSILYTAIAFKIFETEKHIVSNMGINIPFVLLIPAAIIMTEALFLYLGIGHARCRARGLL